MKKENLKYTGSHVHYDHKDKTSYNSDNTYDGHGFNNHGHQCGASLSLRDEFIHHLPYAIFSAAMALIVLSVVSFFAGLSDLTTEALNGHYFTLFHNFHLMHILFSASGTVLMFARFSDSLIKTLLVGIISPAIFCILSDIVIPYLGGIIIGIPMQMHICFTCPHDSSSILMFLLIGVANGIVLRKHSSAILNMFAVGSHFMHILISALASLFFMVSHGFSDWSHYIAYIFVFIIIAVVIPCTISDVIVPLYLSGKKTDKS
jgi:hypothetical protein